MATQPAASLPEEEFESHNRRLDGYLDEVDFAALTPERILAWASETFPGRAVINTSFQMTGVTMIHMAAAQGLDLRFATIDTLRLHPETHEFIDLIRSRFGCQIEVYKPAPAHVEQMVERFGEYLFFDSVEKQEYCCQVRKSRPNDELLKTVDCWIAGLRRDQSAFRRQNATIASQVTELGSRRRIMKLNPLASWTGEMVQAYSDEHDLPVHPLYAQGYPSFGCIICSTPIRAGEEERAGRWRWFNDRSDPGIDTKECGLHYNI